jgi:peptide/nickel transport system permease protein
VKIVLWRLVAAIPLLFLASIGAFLLIRLTPGDPAGAVISENATQAEIDAVHHKFGLDQPLPIQYERWLIAGLHGDLGTAYTLNRSVTNLILDRLPVTLSLAGLAMLISIPVAATLGAIAGANEGSPADRLITVFASIGMAMPSFWIGLLLALFFAVQLGLLPATGYVSFTEDPVAWFTHLLLPAVTLALPSTSELTRQLRSSMADVMHRDYIRTAQAKGLPRLLILGKHAFKNAAIPVVTLLGLQLIAMLGGAVIVESIFGLPGFGGLVVSAANNRDLPILQGVVVVVAIIAVIVNLIVDASYRALNPRVRLT